MDKQTLVRNIKEWVKLDNEINTLNAELVEVRNPPHVISIKVTIGDQPFNTAILVKLQVPYATIPNINPVQKALNTD